MTKYKTLEEVQKDYPTLDIGVFTDFQLEYLVSNNIKTIDEDYNINCQNCQDCSYCMDCVDCVDSYKCYKCYGCYDCINSNFKVVIDDCELSAISNKLLAAIKNKIKVRFFFSKIKFCKEFTHEEISDCIFDMANEKYPNITPKNINQIIEFINENIRH
jgi:hypothetical protein